MSKNVEINHSKPMREISKSSREELAELAARLRKQIEEDDKRLINRFYKFVGEKVSK